MNIAIAHRHLSELSCRYDINVSEDFSFFIVRDINLPPGGYNQAFIDAWIELPRDYPESPPGVGSAHVYVPQGLTFQGRTPKEYHGNVGPKGWAWWCYESIKWDPCTDDLITFVEIIRTHMTDPD